MKNGTYGKVLPAWHNPAGSELVHSTHPKFCRTVENFISKATWAQAEKGQMPV
jgi:hypothetical protein